MLMYYRYILDIFITLNIFNCYCPVEECCFDFPSTYVDTFNESFIVVIQRHSHINVIDIQMSAIYDITYDCVFINCYKFCMMCVFVLVDVAIAIDSTVIIRIYIPDIVSMP